VVGVAAVDHNISLGCILLEEGCGVVVALHDGDVGIEGSEVFGDPAEEHGDGVFGVCSCKSVQDGAADVTCSASKEDLWRHGEWCRWLCFFGEKVELIVVEKLILFVVVVIYI
jgi:hypothetical protein